MFQSGVDEEKTRERRKWILDLAFSTVQRGKKHNSEKNVTFSLCLLDVSIWQKLAIHWFYALIAEYAKSFFFPVSPKWPKKDLIFCFLNNTVWHLSCQHLFESNSCNNLKFNNKVLFYWTKFHSLVVTRCSLMLPTVQDHGQDFVVIIKHQIHQKELM